METRIRKPFEGITNIIRFNWHFYVAALAVAVFLLISRYYFSGGFATLITISFWLLLLSTALSLAVSFYVYDVSGLYTLAWLPSLNIKSNSSLVNINAGFDETSYLLAKKYPATQLIVFDFYDAKQHTEVSIARARKRYAPYPDTISIFTSGIPLPGESVDAAFAILSAHEIRNRMERIMFFTEIKNTLKENGTIIVAEHLRDIANFIAYNAGFFHFFSKREWKRTFGEAGLHIIKETSVTPFIHIFILQKYGTAL